MNDVSVLRTIAVIAAWLTVGGGLLITVIWLAKGGWRAFSPDDEILARSGGPAASPDQPVTAFSSSQIGVHGFFGLTAAILLSYAVARESDRVAGYWGVLVLAAVAIVLGVVIFLTWRTDRRPHGHGDPEGDRGPKVEDGVPRLVVYAHGAGAAITVVLVLALVVVD